MNLDEEVRRGYTIPAEMKKVWKVQMDLLKKLLEVCEKNNLRIWADGGTLLGAVREHGYIPWDDDIDMAMLREDYDKLVEIAPKEFDHPYFFQCAYTEKYYPRGHAQLRMDGTTAILPDPLFVNTHQGVFIDIFPYDDIPNKQDDIDKLCVERQKLYNNLRSAGFRPSLFHPGRSYRNIRNRLYFQKLYRQFEDLFRVNNLPENHIVSCISFIWDPKHFFREKTWYSDTLYVSFEDISIPIPSGYHEILQRQYGDYMQPVIHPSYHGIFYKLDAENSYEKYLPEFRKAMKEHSI